MVEIAVSGPVDVEAGAALTLGSRVGFNASGQIIDDAGTANRAIGTAMEAGGGAGTYAKIALAAMKIDNA